MFLCTIFINSERLLLTSWQECDIHRLIISVHEEAISGHWGVISGHWGISSHSLCYGAIALFLPLRVYFACLTTVLTRFCKNFTLKGLSSEI
jgi:hypothetical protein